jgi:hypothetical protein
MKSLILAAGILAAAQVFAQSNPAPQAPPGAAPFKPLAERKDIISWRLLAQVELVKVKDRFQPQFAAGVSALDAREVKLQGFMMPLEMGDKQSHFILAATPVDCAFCMPGGPESLVEVKTRTPIVYGMEPVVLTGRLAVLKDDPTGVFYRLTDAVASK